MKTRYLRLIKKQRGFTLIELLAVILILGIIALIAIPTVSSVVEQSRKGAAESSAAQFIKAVDELVMTTELDGELLADGLYTSEELEEKGLNIKGTLPAFGYIQIDKGQVIGCNLTYGNYNVTCNDGNFNSINNNEAPKFTIDEDRDSNSEVSIGDKICLSTECFYVIGFTDEGDIKMLTEWNLNVGYDLTMKGSYDIDTTKVGTFEFDSEKEAQTLTGVEYTNITPAKSLISQSNESSGYTRKAQTVYNLRGVISFAKLDRNLQAQGKTYSYWSDDSEKMLPKYPGRKPYVYDENSNAYYYVNSYLENLKMLSGKNIISARLITCDELETLGCSPTDGTCKNSRYPWIMNTSYWTGTSAGPRLMYFVLSTGFYTNVSYHYLSSLGVRPVITIPKSAL